MAVFFVLVSGAEAASLRFSPTGGSYNVGTNFTVNILVDSSGEAINATEGLINFPTNRLRVVSLSKTGSIHPLWVTEPSYSNIAGTIQFEGVTITPGFTGSGGRVLGIVFQGVSPGTADVNFESGSVLANDGDGTDITESLGSAVYAITDSAPVTAPAVPVVKHYIQTPAGEVLHNSSGNGTKWTNSVYNRLGWFVPTGVTAVAFRLDDSPNADPGVSGPVVNSKTYEMILEGRHYFHIRFVNQGRSGPILHYPVFVDLTAPPPFQINILETAPIPRLSFLASDELSGISHYEIQIQNGSWTRVNHPDNQNYALRNLTVGVYPVAVRAVDNAGNFREASASLTIPAPVEEIAPPTRVEASSPYGISYTPLLLLVLIFSAFGLLGLITHTISALRSTLLIGSDIGVSLHVTKAVGAFTDFLYLTNAYVLSAGALINLTAFVLSRDPFSFAFLLANVAMNLLKLVLLSVTARSMGIVTDAQSGRPIPLVAARFYKSKNNRLVVAAVTGDNGRFAVVTACGGYYLVCSKRRYHDFKTKAFGIGKSGLIADQIRLTPKP